MPNIKGLAKNKRHRITLAVVRTPIHDHVWRQHRGAWDPQPTPAVPKSSESGVAHKGSRRPAVASAVWLPGIAAWQPRERPDPVAILVVILAVALVVLAVLGTRRPAGGAGTAIPVEGGKRTS